jgi:hypothetical protein
MAGDSESGASILRDHISLEDGEQSGSPWPKRLLIVGSISLLLGTLGLAIALPDIEEVLRPDVNYAMIIEPSTTESLEVTGLNKYAFYQNVTEDDFEPGTLTIHDGDGGEVELFEPTLTAAVTTLNFDDGATFEPLGWIRATENGELTLSSTSNLSIYVIDQNAIDELTMQQFDMLASCGALLIGGCLLPVAGLLHFLRPKTAIGTPTVTMRSSDGREVSISIDSTTGTGPVLTTDQVYALTKLQDNATDGGEMKIEFLVQEQAGGVPPPFSDRPDQPLDKHPSKVVRPSSEERASKESHTSATDKTSGSKKGEAAKESWKDWDEG